MIERKSKYKMVYRLDLPTALVDEMKKAGTATVEPCQDGNWLFSIDEDQEGYIIRPHYRRVRDKVEMERSNTDGLCGASNGEARAE